MSAEAVFFYAFGGLAVVAAIAMVSLVRDTVSAALSLVVTMVALSGVFVILGAYFLAAVQLLVYAGAIVVLFLFVIMLLAGSERGGTGFSEVPRGRLALRSLGAIGVALALGFGLRREWAGEALSRGPALLPEGFGGFRDVGLQLFTVWVVPVELVGLVLLAAIVGAVVLARPREG